MGRDFLGPNNLANHWTEFSFRFNHWPASRYQLVAAKYIVNFDKGTSLGVRLLVHGTLSGKQLFSGSTSLAMVPNR